MLVGLNAGFGDPLPLPTCEALATVCDVVRFDALLAGPHKGPARLVSEAILDETLGNLVAAGLKGMPLLSFPLETPPPSYDLLRERTRWLLAHWRDHLAAFSTGWEGNHRAAQYAPSSLAAWVNCVHVEAGGVPVAADLTNNMHRESLEYYAQAFRDGLTCDWIGAHDYTTTDPWHKPGRGSGWKSREEKWRNWKTLARQYDVELAVTEWGYHTAASNAPRYVSVLGKQVRIGTERVQYDEGQVADFVGQRLYDHYEQGCVASCIFQHRDATADPSHEGSYGLWTADGQTKLVYNAVRATREKVR